VYLHKIGFQQIALISSCYYAGFLDMVDNYSVCDSFNKKFHELFYIAITRGMVETGILQKMSRNSPDGGNNIRFGGPNVWMYPNNGFGVG
jgi:hypothetical protein